MKYLRFALIALLVSASTTACAEQGDSSPNINVGAMGDLTIKNFKQVEPNIYSAGQPSETEIKQLAEAGIKVIINLRPQAEMNFDEQGLVESLGMQYISIPVAGADEVSADKAERLANAIKGLEGQPIVVHCASANRVGALVALDEALNHGASVDEAIKKGKEWGMTRLESVVRYQLSE